MKIAIDGTASSGKGTLSVNLSKELKLPLLDTGLLYRKVAYELIINKKDNSTNLEYCSFEVAKNLNFLK